MKMTLNDFVDAVKDDVLNDKAIKKKWATLCNALLSYDAHQISELIKEGGLESLCEIENIDGFGTEGMEL